MASTENGSGSQSLAGGLQLRAARDSYTSQREQFLAPALSLSPSHGSADKSFPGGRREHAAERDKARLVCNPFEAGGTSIPIMKRIAERERNGRTREGNA